MTPEVLILKAQQIILILFSLTGKHFFADFVFQSEWMVRQKGYYGKPGGLAYAAIHGLLTACLFWYLQPNIALTCGLVDAAAHYHIDYIKMRLNRISNLTAADRNFWFLLGLDQYAHYATYLAIMWFAIPYLA